MAICLSKKKPTLEQRSITMMQAFESITDGCSPHTKIKVFNAFKDMLEDDFNLMSGMYIEQSRRNKLDSERYLSALQKIK